MVGEQQLLGHPGTALRNEISARRNEFDEHILAAGQRVQELEYELAQIKASERWRLGGVVAIPAAAVKRLFIR